MSDTTTIQLEPGETLREYNARKRFEHDCGEVLGVIEKNPGIPSKSAVADELGKGLARVKRCMKALGLQEFPQYHRIEYGRAKAKSGRYAAADPVQGWFSMRQAVHHVTLEQADDHEERVVQAITYKRIVRLVTTKLGLTSKEAGKAVIIIAERLEIDLTDPKFSSADEAALVELILEEAA